MIILAVVVASSCSGTRKLQPEDRLFAGTEVTYTDKEHITNRREMRNLIEVNQVTPNDPGFLNIKTGLYNLMGKTKGKGMRHRIKYGWGSKPILYKDGIQGRSERKIQKALQEYGYLRAQISCDTVPKKRKVFVECQATLGERYIIDSVFYIQDSLEITQTLKPMYDITYTRPGKYYELKNLLQDRAELVTTANNNGYPYVNGQDVVFFLDTLAGDRKVDVHMRLRPSDDSLKYQRFRYGGIYINPNYSLERDSPTDSTNMVKFDEYNISEGYDFLREDALNKAIYINEGNIFNQKKRKITVDRLLDFGLFKFVNVKTVPNREKKTLDHYLNLTTHQMESVSGELEINNRQGNIFGTAGKISYVNRNIFRGAERFELALSGGLETQLGSKQSFINQSSIRLESSLTLPNVVLPLVQIRSNSNFIPKTFMSVSLAQENRFEFYTVRAASAKYGFRWHETKNKTSFLTPIDVSWLVLTNTTPRFDSILMNDPRQALSFQTTLVPGLSYVYEYNRRDKFDPTNQSFFRGTFESAGNLLSLLSTTPAGQTQATLFGTPLARFIRMTADVRQYWSAGAGSFATKLVVGAGFAFGNTELPYSKQYSIGGANSIRAYRLRTLGPGLYQSPSGNTNQFIDQTGDIKIESSVEYRFPIVAFLKGALFVDAGNVWVLDSADKPEGVFNINTFADQIAVGTGIGLRFDFDFIVLRFDLGFPIRDIESSGQFEWVHRDIAPFSRSWRNDNLRLQFGLGYPF